MRFRAAFVVCMILLLSLVSCVPRPEEPEIGEYKPAIMVSDRLYWLSPTGDVEAIPEGCAVIGQIMKISAQIRPPESDWEAIGFSDDFLGADIYQGEDEDTVYVYNAELKRYIAFEAEVHVDSTVGRRPVAVPFLLTPYPWDRPASAVHLGSWNLDRGRVRIGDLPVFTFDGPPGELEWDGGHRIVVSSYSMHQKVLIDCAHPDYEILVLDQRVSPLDLVKYPSTGEFMTIGPQQSLEIRSPGGVEEVPLDLDLAPDWVYYRTVAIDTEDHDRITLYVQAEHTVDETSLLRGSLVGQDMVWSTVSENLEVSEAGAGTRMVLWGDRLAIAEQHAEVKALCLETGQLFPLDEVNARLRSFASDNIEGEYQYGPAGLYTFEDLLVVSWTPVVHEEDPSGGPRRRIWMTCIVACSPDGRVIGEIRAVEESLIVVRGGEVTQELAVTEIRHPSRWRFPRE